MNDASGAAPPLKTENLAKHFRQGDATIEALKDVSLTVQRGEFVAVMGPSGSGKSTLLHVMAGLTRPARGRILVEGSDLSTMSDRQLTLFRRRRIGLVFQAFNLIPTLTAQDNILLPALVEGHDRHATGAKLDELLTRLDLTSR
ncbi:MAG: ATP-binding cassette domain-containing protein, partial [Patescibacteria group bacterium]|nr:ATP-binding cassette domain-containing protein [Patescibacteria group bacterium]